MCSIINLPNIVKNCEMTIPKRHVAEENTLQKKSEPPTYFPKPPLPKVNRRFPFLYFFKKPSLSHIVFFSSVKYLL